jgi:hypothetical protein
MSFVTVRLASLLSLPKGSSITSQLTLISVLLAAIGGCGAKSTNDNSARDRVGAGDLPNQEEDEANKEGPSKSDKDSNPAHEDDEKHDDEVINDADDEAPIIDGDDEFIRDDAEERADDDPEDDIVDDEFLDDEQAFDDDRAWDAGTTYDQPDAGPGNFDLGLIRDAERRCDEPEGDPLPITSPADQDAQLVGAWLLCKGSVPFIPDNAAGIQFNANSTFAFLLQDGRSVRVGAGFDNRGNYGAIDNRHTEFSFQVNMEMPRGGNAISPTISAEPRKLFIAWMGGNSTYSLIE